MGDRGLRPALFSVEAAMFLALAHSAWLAAAGKAGTEGLTNFAVLLGEHQRLHAVLGGVGELDRADAALDVLDCRCNARVAGARRGPVRQATELPAGCVP